MSDIPISPLAAALMIDSQPPLSRLLRYTIPASATKEGKDREKAYYEALGRFMDMFSQVETAITLTLWAYARCPKEIAKIAFAGVKIEVSSTYIKQFATATNAPKDARDDLEDVLQQVGIINGVRNAITHFGATQVAEGTAYVSNAVKAKGEPTIFPISPTALDEMWKDLRKITFHLNYRHLGRAVPKATLNHLMLQTTLNEPWRYKYPIPKGPESPGTQADQPRQKGQLRQQQSSPSKGPKLSKAGRRKAALGRAKKNESRRAP